jgi:hypothetical protein
MTRTRRIAWLLLANSIRTTSSIATDPQQHGSVDSAQPRRDGVDECRLGLLLQAQQPPPWQNQTRQIHARIRLPAGY